MFTRQILQMLQMAIDMTANGKILDAENVCKWEFSWEDFPAEILQTVQIRKGRTASNLDPRIYPQTKLDKKYQVSAKRRQPAVVDCIVDLKSQ